MTSPKYKLETYKGMKTRYYCPECNDRGKTFTRYIDTETGEHLNPNVGRCNREVKCGYHYTPSDFFRDRPGNYHPQIIGPKKQRIEPSQPVSYFPAEIVKTTLKGYEQNNLFLYLMQRIGETDTRVSVKKYLLGTSKQFGGGAAIFWQIDLLGRIRTGKIMQYDPATGKRIKYAINWAHCFMNIEKPPQCFFGEHLLADTRKPIAIVESEKTAMIANAYLPEFTWMAAGAKQGLTEEKCRVLKGRKVTLFPDLGAFDDWRDKAERFKSIADFQVSDYLERMATPEEKEQGLDIADFLHIPF